MTLTFLSGPDYKFANIFILDKSPGTRIGKYPGTFIPDKFNCE